MAQLTRNLAALADENEALRSKNVQLEREVSAMTCSAYSSLLTLAATLFSLLFLDGNAALGKRDALLASFPCLLSSNSRCVSIILISKTVKSQ